MSKKSYASTQVPESVLTPALLLKYEARIKARPVMKKNKHGGRAIELYLDDGVSGDRKVDVEFPDLVSTFGISSMKSDQKTESGQPKDSLSIAFPLFKNGAELQQVTDCFDRIAKREVCQHWEALFGQKKSAEVLADKLQPCAKVPQKKESAAQYGPNFKIGIYEKGVRYFDANGEEVSRDQLMLKDENGNLVLGTDAKPKGRPGRYTVRCEVPRIYFMAGDVYGMVFKLKRMMYEPEQEDDELFVTKVVGKAKAADAGSTTHSTPVCDKTPESLGESNASVANSTAALPPQSSSSMDSTSCGSAATPDKSSVATTTSAVSAPPSAAVANVSASPPGGPALDGEVEESGKSGVKRKAAGSVESKPSKKHKS